MKKKILTLAVFGAFAGAAQAQSSITIYGAVDAGIRELTNTNAAGDSRLTMGSTGTYRTNRFGFKGTEDLGGGLNTHFKLEGGFTTATGALAGDIFGRTALVGIGGPWGTVDMGRLYSVTFTTNANYEPFFNSYWTGFALAGVQGGAVRLSNDIQYSKQFGQLTVLAEYALGEVAGDNKAGSTTAIGGNYVAGPVNFGGAYMTRKNVAGTATQRNWSAGGAYTSGPLRVAIGYGDDSRDAGFTNPAETKIKDIWVGGTYAVTPVLSMGAAYYRNTTDVGGVTGHKNLYILASTYSLSNRTNLYADLDIGQYSGTYNNPLIAQPTGQDHQRGISVGIAHIF